MAERMTVRDLMSLKVATVARKDTVEIADGMMTMGRIRHLPVLDGSEVVGVLSQRDLFRSVMGAALAYGMGRPQEILRTLNVGDVMTVPAETIGPEAPVQGGRPRHGGEEDRLPARHRRGAAGGHPHRHGHPALRDQPLR